MRILLLLLPTVLIGCAPHNSNLQWYGLSAPQEVIGKARPTLGLTKEPFELPVDKTLYEFTVADCPDGVERLFKDKVDSFSRVEARWRQLDCYYKGVQGRSLVVFLDGTGNTQKSNTNIWRLYNMALLRAMEQKPENHGKGKESATAIIPYYDRGVGTDFRALSGNVFGAGVSGNIRQAYRFLVETYQPGDKIFLFGFSRGAFTARSLNGMIRFSGLADLKSMQPDVLDSIPLGSVFGNFHRKANGLFDAYSKVNDGASDFDARLSKTINEYKSDKKITTHPVVIEAIGVFDTVPAIGVTRNDDPDGHRLELYARRGFHAMSLDEQRDDFRLLRFSVPQSSGQKLEEMWFTGVHSDVGGGYAGQASESCGSTSMKNLGLEGITLSWMMARFKEYEIFPASINPGECMTAPLHDEYFTERWLRRNVFKAAGIYRRRPVACDSVHETVIQRTSNKLQVPHPKREIGGIYSASNLGHTPLSTFCVLNTDKTRDDCRCEGSSPSTTTIQ
ncbi:phospholipase effector Tle1 domain-containing protein [Pseudomonas lini]